MDKKITFFMWLIVGILILISGKEPSKLMYILLWICYLLELTDEIRRE